MRRLVAAIDDPLREVTRQTTRIPTDRYTDPAQLDSEQRALFRRRPVIVAHESELAAPGDVVTERVGGVPLIILRDASEHIRVFVNACRHRGAQLVSEPTACGKKALTCPYHAWSYGLDGGLLHIPRADAFGDLAKTALGLIPVCHELRHGFVWVVIDGSPDEPSIDVAGFLGPTLDDDFTAFGLATHIARRTSVHQTASNWKLVMDAFAEGYHVRSLHQRSLARFFVDGSIVDDCAPHVRQVGARKTFVDASRQPEHTWDLRKHTTVFYNLFPNAVLVFHPYWLSLLTMFPEAVDRVRVVHRALIPRPPDDDEQRERLDKSFAHIDRNVFEDEDLMIAANIQRTLSAGVSREILLGGLEHGMRLFHRARDRALRSDD